MLSTVSAQPGIVWNEKTILDNGMIFLSQKNEELKLFQDLWNITKNSNRESSYSNNIFNQVKVITKESIKEIESLSDAVVQILNVESAKDPYSDRVKELSKIAQASLHGLNYFNQVSELSDYYSRIRSVAKSMIEFLDFSLTITTSTVGGLYICDYAIPSQLLVAWKVSFVSYICLSVFEKFITLGQEGFVDDRAYDFEKALSQN